MHSQQQKVVSPEDAMKIMVKGYMKIQKFNLIEEAIVLIGNTKQGKTTLLHMIAKSALIGDKNNMDNIVYKVKTPDSRIANAEIGGIQSVSQTKIPNIALLEIGHKNIHVVDLPGFMDSGATLDTLSNRYFIKSIFQKMKNIKFVIVTKFNSILQKKVTFLDAIKQFFTIFKHDKEVLKTVFKSTCIYVMAVPLQKTKENVIKFFSDKPIGRFNAKENQIYKLMIKEFEDNKKFFMTYAAELGKVPSLNQDVGQIINQSSNVWFSRNAVNEKKVQMCKINFNMIEEADNSKLKSFEKEMELFVQFIKFELFQNTIKNKFVKLIDSLIIFTTEDNFSDYSQPFAPIESKQKFLENINSNEEYQQLLKKVLFSNDKSKSASQGIFNSEVQKKKFIYMKAIYLLESIAAEIHLFQSQRKEEESKVKFILEKEKQIINIINQIAPTEYKKVFRDFTFSMYSRLQILEAIEQICNQTIITNKQNKQNNEMNKILRHFITEFKKMLENSYMWVDLPILKKVINFLIDIDEQELKQNQKGTEYIIAFFEQIIKKVTLLTVQEMEDKELNQKYINSKVLKLKLKKLKIQSKMNEVRLFTLQNSELEKMKESLKQLFICRQMIFKLLYDEQIKKQDEVQVFTMGIKILQIMAEFFKRKKHLKFALHIYQNLGDSYEALLTRQSLEDEMMLNFRQKTFSQKEEVLNFIQQTGQFSYVHGRNSLSIQKYSQAYSLAQKLGKNDKIKAIGNILAFLKGDQSITIDQVQELLEKKAEHKQLLTEDIFDPDIIQSTWITQSIESFKIKDI